MDIDLTPGRRPFCILLVSTGDVCRAPAARLLLSDALARRPGTAGRFALASAGTRAPQGCDLHPLTAAALSERGLDPGGHQARELTAALVAEADLVLVAERQHRLAVAQLHPDAAPVTFTVRELARAVTRAAGPEGSGGGRHRLITLPEQGEATPPAQPWGLAEALLARHEVWRPAHPSEDDLADPITGGPGIHRRMVDELAAAVELCAGVLAPYRSGVAPGAHRR